VVLSILHTSTESGEANVAGQMVKVKCNTFEIKHAGYMAVKENIESITLWTWLLFRIKTN
jgi:hypothetical protein